jgi:flagellar biosynthesis protein FlhA
VGEVVGSDSDVSVALLQRVLRNLLKDGIPIRELTVILEALAENATKTKNPTTLTEVVRKSLARTITEQCRDASGKIPAITFDPTLEHQLIATLGQEGGELVLGLPTETTMEVNRRAAEAWKAAMDQGRDKIVLLCDARLRAPLSQMLSRTLPMLPVVAYDEIVLGVEVQPVETLAVNQERMEAEVGQDELAAAAAEA